VAHQDTNGGLVTSYLSANAHRICHFSTPESVLNKLGNGGVGVINRRNHRA
jgi:hypothetical protein